MILSVGLSFLNRPCVFKDTGELRDKLWKSHVTWVRRPSLSVVLWATSLSCPVLLFWCLSVLLPDAKALDSRLEPWGGGQKSLAVGGGVGCPYLWPPAPGHCWGLTIHRGGRCASHSTCRLLRSWGSQDPEWSPLGVSHLGAVTGWPLLACSVKICQMTCMLNCTGRKYSPLASPHGPHRWRERVCCTSLEEKRVSCWQDFCLSLFPHHSFWVHGKRRAEAHVFLMQRNGRW